MIASRNSSSLSTALIGTFSAATFLFARQSAHFLSPDTMSVLNLFRRIDNSGALSSLWWKSILELRIRSPVALYFVEKSPWTIFSPFVERILMSVTVSLRKFTSLQKDMIYRTQRTPISNIPWKWIRGLILEKRIKNSILWSQVYNFRNLLLNLPY